VVRGALVVRPVMPPLGYSGMFNTPPINVAAPLEPMVVNVVIWFA